MDRLEKFYHEFSILKKAAFSNKQGSCSRFYKGQYDHTALSMRKPQKQKSKQLVFYLVLQFLIFSSQKHSFPSSALCDGFVYLTNSNVPRDRCNTTLNEPCSYCHGCTGTSIISDANYLPHVILNRMLVPIKPREGE